MNKRENFWVVIIWFLVFMLVLTWDQEKIVVLNLVLFCYFIRYLVGNSIDSTLSQRRSVLLDSLSTDLATQISFLKRLVVESRSTLLGYKEVVLSIIKKVLVVTNNTLTGTLNHAQGLSFNFKNTQLSLQSFYSEITTKQVEQNIFISSQIIVEVSPLISLETENKEE